MLDITLEIPLSALLLGGRAQGDKTADARIEARGDALDDAPLASSIATLEDDDNLEALQTHPFLHFEELELQADELVRVFVVRRWFIRWLAVADNVPALF